MKRTFSILFAAVISIVLFVNAFQEKEVVLAREQVISDLKQNTKDFLVKYDSLFQYVKTHDCKNEDIVTARALYIQTRLAYKRIEWATAYFASGTAEMLNSALIPKVAEDDPSQITIDPEGLQFIEELLWADPSEFDHAVLLAEIKRSRGAVIRLQQLFFDGECQDFQLFEAIKQQNIRTWSLGLAGFDAPYSGAALKEAAASMRSIEDVLQAYYRETNKRKVKKAMKDLFKQTALASEVLEQANNFEDFDRAAFIKDYANPIYAAINQVQIGLGISNTLFITAVNDNANTLFHSDSWNLNFYTSARKNEQSEARVLLGRMLFFDPVLSGNNEIACASCHRPEHGFAEPLATSQKFESAEMLNRNAPSLLNVGIQKGLFWDARLTYLEDQVVDVNQNSNEMHGNFNENVLKLRNSNAYKKMFKQAFPNSVDSQITKDGIIKAIAAYERSLTSFNSRFDQYMRGNSLALNTSEIRGFNLFMGKGLCGTCHFAPVFNGTVPPQFEKTEWEIIGVPATAEQTSLDSDVGRFGASGMELHKFAFKTPSIRNVAYTAPYMHNGVYKTLEEVMQFYKKGGGAGHGYEVPNQTLPFDQLDLTDGDITDIIAFMKATSDTVGLTTRPSQLPSFEGKMEYLNNRKISGQY